ncbi:putative glycoside hydrolase [Neobacillus mesonae]|uniref:putative glycoside hydrolase n=1 Tax=Neobacillus mesonae TaxID=1193713 RepID=UPI0025745F82|nr:putative glycoside hydrolase [Neobacillus mesonae]
MRKLFIFVIFLAGFLIPNSAHATPLEYKSPVRGIYVQAANTHGPKFNQLLNLVNQSDLNAMVIDVKDDHGTLTFRPPKDSPYQAISQPYIKDPAKLIHTLIKHNIYPIARIVVFKDNVLAKSRPDWSFKSAKGVWKNARGDSFTNPFVKQVWDYNIGIAIEAAKIGFKEIQFDYVRFPEKFETFEASLQYMGQSKKKSRVSAVSEFVKTAHESLKPYGVKMSVDIFGNATVIPEAPGIGQNFSEIAKHVDVISAMIYPSHWTGIFGIKKPDLEPYRLVSEYAKMENFRLKKLSKPPISRPWLQDFTASYLGKGNYKVYGKKEIEDQIRALNSQGIHEFLIWNAENNYTPNVNYKPY